MRQSTVLNIFYEIGLMNALGKETIVIKNRDFNVPSDLVRTEYIEYNDTFDEKFQKFIDRTFEVSEYYVTMAENLLAKPILTLDYLRRAYLISAKEEIKERAKEIILTHPFDEHTNLMIRNYFNIKEPS